MAGGWSIERATGSARDFHARPLPDPCRRSAWLFDVGRPTLVLGSTQPDADVDAEALAARGVELVRRRSGGGAVLLAPGEVVWIDVVIPTADPLWHHDVGRASEWVGHVWAAALARLGFRAEVHRGAVVRTPWSRQVCFAGLGPGEVTVAGRKVVGVSQRRTRAGARFQCAALVAWEPSAIVELLDLEADDRVGALASLADVVAAVPVCARALADAFVASLPDSGS